MRSPERIRSSVKGDIRDSVDLKSARARGEEEPEGDERRKHRSSKPRKSGSGEDVEGLEGSGRRRSSGEKNENRKRSSGSSRAGTDEDDYESRKESRSKLMKKKQEESALDSLSNWYQDGEAENRHDGGDKSRSKGHGRADESERRKSISKLSEHENSQSGSKGKDEKSHDGDVERQHKKEARYSDRRDSNQEKGHGSSEQGRNQKKRWDEPDATKVEDITHGEKSDLRTGIFSDSKRENVRERSSFTKNEPGEGKKRDVDLNDDKGVKSFDKEERRVFSEKRKSKGSAEAPEEDRDSPSTREDISIKERLEDNRQQRHSSGRENIDTYERSFNVDEDGNALMRDKSRREIEHSSRSNSLERSARRHQEPDHVEMDHSTADRRKDLEKDGYRDERLKGRDDSWSDRNRDIESSRDSWKRRHPNVSDRETKDGDALYEQQGREWESQRRGRERADNERVLGRSGGRKDGNRTEAVKTSSNYGISNENYDVIEIQTKPFDYGREDSRSTFGRKAEGSQLSGPNDNEYAYPRENRAKNTDMYGSGQSVEDSKYMDDGATTRDQIPWRDDSDFQAGKGRGQRGVMSIRGGQTSNSSSQPLPPHESQESGSSSRGVPQGAKGIRLGRGGRGRPTGRESQQLGIPMPMMGSPFGPLGMPPPGVLQPLTPSMSPGPGPPMSPGVFIPPFSPPVLWPGARALEMNMLAVPPSLSTVPPGPRFPPNLGTPPNTAMYFNQPGPGRGMPPNITGPGFNTIGPAGRGQSQDKPTGGWVPPPRVNGPPGKAPSRGEQNDYSQNFVDTGMRPQNFIRELELTSVVEDYPKLRELIQKKDEIVANSATAPMYYKCDLREQVLSAEFFGTKFDVILVDPPWEEYVHRAPGVTDHMEYWTFEEIMNLKIEAIADTPSFIFLWVGDGVGLEQGRQCLKKWGFRRCEDICWVKTNKSSATPGSRHDAHTLFQRSKEHCLMGIKGTVRRSTDGHIIHANIDTDVIIAEEPSYGSTEKPEDMYRIVEHFSLGRRRLELFGEDHNIRSGWLTVGKDLTSSNFNAEAYVRNFADKDGKVWQGGGGRNPPPEAGHLVVTTPDIEALRPKSPMKNQQQLQHQHSSNAISLTTANSSNKRQTGNSPADHSGISMNQEASSSNMMVPIPWGGGGMGGDDRNFEMYGGYNGPFGPVSGDFLDFEAHRAMNLL